VVVCKELEEELKYGKSLAENLCQHLEVMGADKLEIPVERDSGCYIVKVIKTL
jgi:hypothetical protein